MTELVLEARVRRCVALYQPRAKRFVANACGLAERSVKWGWGLGS